MDNVAFRVSKLSASVPESIPLEWQGRSLESGTMTIELDPDSAEGNRGVMDYGVGRANAEFHVLLSFPELAETLEGLGVDPEFTKPVRAVLRSEGEIRDDHRLALSGDCDLREHKLFPPEESKASVLPGH